MGLEGTKAEFEEDQTCASSGYSLSLSPSPLSRSLLLLPSPKSLFFAVLCPCAVSDLTPAVSVRNELGSPLAGRKKAPPGKDKEKEMEGLTQGSAGASSLALSFCMCVFRSTSFFLCCLDLTVVPCPRISVTAPQLLSF